MELINGMIFDFKSENLKLVRFENNDQIVMRAAMAILSQMRKEGCAITYVVETQCRLDLMMTERSAAYFEGQLVCSAFYEHVKELSEKRDHILGVLASLADKRIGTPTISDEFIYDEGSMYERRLAVHYKKDGSVNVKDLEDQFWRQMHLRSDNDDAACAEYDFDFTDTGKAPKMYRLFSKEIFSMSK